MKTHKVIDLLFPEEGIAFTGTKLECEQFLLEQGGIGYAMAPLTPTESEIENSKP